ncbi:unnamed protein product [Rhizophagus irregularis]|nr:unnamed protein product [Rhizophagus irregularis]
MVLNSIFQGPIFTQHQSNDEISGYKQSGEYQDPDMALIDHFKNYTHIGFRYFTDVLMSDIVITYQEVSVPAFPVTHFEGSRLFGHPFRKFSHFRSPISEVPAFPVTHFEGSRISGHPFWRFPPFRSPISKVLAFPITHFRGSRLSGHPFRRFSHFRSPILEVPAFSVTHFESFRISGTHFEGSSISFGLVKFEMMVKVFRLGASKRNGTLWILDFDSLRLLIPGWDAERGICRLQYSKVKMVLLSSVFKFGF